MTTQTMSPTAGCGKLWHMDKQPPPAMKPITPSRKLAERRKREAEALRANLRKRKDQARAREKPKQE